VTSPNPTQGQVLTVAGKCPSLGIALCFAPLILSAVFCDISGVLDQSYSPVSMYTGHVFVSILATRERPSQPPK